eukprot:jgi/Botrbrau1/3507/Bobra.341_2s0036.1
MTNAVECTASGEDGTVQWPESFTTVVDKAVPSAVLQDLIDVAETASLWPNLWITKERISSRTTSGPIESAARHLYEKCLCRMLPSCWTGVEWWVQVYQPGRGLAFHFDKDEKLFKNEGRMVHPIFSSILYLYGEETAPPLGATVVVDQVYDAHRRRLVPSNPQRSALLVPRANRFAIFDGRLAHGVLDWGSGAPRMTLLFNWWSHQPLGVGPPPQELQSQMNSVLSKANAARSKGSSSLNHSPCSACSCSSSCSAPSPPHCSGSSTSDLTAQSDRCHVSTSCTSPIADGRQSDGRRVSPRCTAPNQDERQSNGYHVSPGCTAPSERAGQPEEHHRSPGCTTAGGKAGQVYKCTGSPGCTASCEVAGNSLDCGEGAAGVERDCFGEVNEKMPRQLHKERVKPSGTPTGNTSGAPADVGRTAGTGGAKAGQSDLHESEGGSRKSTASGGEHCVLGCSEGCFQSRAVEGSGHSEGCFRTRDVEGSGSLEACFKSQDLKGNCCSEDCVKSRGVEGSGSSEGCIKKGGVEGSGCSEACCKTGDTEGSGCSEDCFKSQEVEGSGCSESFLRSRGVDGTRCSGAAFQSGGVGWSECEHSGGASIIGEGSHVMREVPTQPLLVEELGVRLAAWDLGDSWPTTGDGKRASMESEGWKGGLEGQKSSLPEERAVPCSLCGGFHSEGELGEWSGAPKESSAAVHQALQSPGGSLGQHHCWGAETVGQCAGGSPANVCAFARSMPKSLGHSLKLQPQMLLKSRTVLMSVSGVTAPATAGGVLVDELLRASQLTVVKGGEADVAAIAIEHTGFQLYPLTPDQQELDFNAVQITALLVPNDLMPDDSEEECSDSDADEHVPV